jgi:dsDNA-binding SOS-regulon protein
VLHYFTGTLKKMFCVLQNAVISFPDVQRENLQKPMACDTTIYSRALKHYNNTGKVQTDYQEGNREVDHKT